MRDIIKIQPGTAGSTVAPRVMSAAEREQLRHPMERRIVTVVAIVEMFLIASFSLGS